jgi:hypothetical protein
LYSHNADNINGRPIASDEKEAIIILLRDAIKGAKEFIIDRISSNGHQMKPIIPNTGTN